ncbi:EAP30/Vps36 family-domain-containing protein [Dunaliella salina]|uniref:Vacuolar protein-sorting-associated protein 36 n=1 Tax=Dunaliella salina TaxID=3046 RepID=A0ABQ7G4W4_DUNSA|nr:EAP30/Vps36 family-domain-containing protein [Dunaliella salina]|eukprot:KAF5829645.1 EAP30/Vps36 family-domain-containing protein [Dunaliella salina]
MIVLDPVQLTPSGRPVLLPGEVEHHLLDKVDLEFDPEGGLPGLLAKAYKTGYVILTSHRTLWMESSASPAEGTVKSKLPSFLSHSGIGSSNSAAAAAAPQSESAKKHCSMPVRAVRGVAKRTAFSLSGAKVRLHLEVCVSTTDHRPIADSRASGAPTRTIQLALRCRGDSPDTLAAKLEDLLRTAAPAAPQPLTQAPSRPASLPPHAAPPPASIHQTQPPPSLPAQPPPPPPPHVDQSMLMQLMDMGFPRNKCARALAATQSSDLQAALDFILSFGDLPEMDQPVHPPTNPIPTSLYPQALQPPPPIPLYPPPPHWSPAAPTGGGAPSLQQQQQQQQQHLPHRTYPHRPSQPQQLPRQEQSLPWMMGGLHLHHHQQQQQQQELTTVNPLRMPPMDAPQGPVPTPAFSQAGPQESLGAIGIGGIVRREQQKSSQAGRSLSAAFQDLSALMTMAEEMVALANKFRAVSNTSDVGSNDDVLDSDTQADLIAMGIASPVTKETAGARYHVELCRQLADFLHEPLSRVGGLMPLTDVYCLFNRARGTELVSPDDLLAAAQLFQQVGLPLRLRTFPSGFTAIQSAAHSDDAVCAAISQMVQPKRRQQPQQERQDLSQYPVEGSDALRGAPQSLANGKVVVLAPSPTPQSQSDDFSNTVSHDATTQGLNHGGEEDDLVAGSASSRKDSAMDAAARMIETQLGPGITALDVARALRVATSIAGEHLLTAEARGVVCRDEGPEGTRFFRNFFKDDWPLLVS